MSTGDSPGKYPWREIAARAYLAYGASTGGRNYRGEPMPAFEDLPRAIQVAWEAAVRHAVRCADVAMNGEPVPIGDENRWHGWVPP